MGDPCQTQEDAVDDLESQIESLQSELETATPTEMQCPELTGSIEGYRIAVDLSTATGTVGSPDAHGFRDMRITANAHVTIAGPLINQTTDVSMTLTTDGTLSVQEFGENIEGSPINGNGFMTMVGEGTSGDQMLDIRLQGTVKPVPWQIS
jgi:hypothetical protein